MGRTSFEIGIVTEIGCTGSSGGILLLKEGLTEMKKILSRRMLPREPVHPISVTVPISKVVLPILPPSTVEEGTQKLHSQLIAGIPLTAVGWLLSLGVIPSRAILPKHKLCMAFFIFLEFLALILHVKLSLSASTAAPSDEGILGYPVLWFHLNICASIFINFLLILFLKMSFANFLRSCLEFMGLLLVVLAIPPILQLNCPNFFKLCFERLCG